MKGFIDEEFLIKNLFEKSKIGAGYHTWNYEDKKYRVSLATWTDGGRVFIYVDNYETRQSINFEKRKPEKLTKEDLHKCIEFLNVPNEFDYA